MSSYRLNDSSGWEASSPRLSRPKNTKTRASADSTAFSSTISLKLMSLSEWASSSASSSYTLKRCAAALPSRSVTWAVGSPGGHMSSSNPGASFTAAMQVTSWYDYIPQANRSLVLLEFCQTSDLCHRHQMLPAANPVSRAIPDQITDHQLLQK